MNTKHIKLFSLFICIIISLNAFGYTFSRENADGITIYYNYSVGELEVTSGPNKYSGDIVIPDEVIWAGQPRKVTCIDERAFYECTELTSLTLCDNITYIEDYAFANCSGLKSLTLSNSLTNTGKYAFWNCIGLTTLTLPESMTAIAGGAFSGCKGLLSITIPDNVTSIGVSAFAGCTSVKTITIGKNVSQMGGNALACGDDVETVYSWIENPFEIYGISYGSMAFRQGTFRNAILYVPDESIEKYKNTKGWKDFTNIKPISSAYIHKLSYIVDGEEYSFYNIKEGEVTILEPDPIKIGYTFSGWSEIPETMPDHDVTVTGSFAINKYTLTYMVDGQVYKTYDVDYNTTITPEPAPVREGYTFSGWNEIPETMPANDVTVTGSFAINKYKITYIVDGNVVTTQDAEYGSTIVPPATDSSGNAISWNSHPTTMPAYDITIYGSYITGIDAINYNEGESHYYSLNGEHLEKPRKGINIVKRSDGTVKKVVVK